MILLPQHPEGLPSKSTYFPV